MADDGSLEVHDEPEVRLVVAHAQGARGDDGLHLVGQQPALGLDAVLVGHLAGVGDRADPLGLEPLRDELGVALREAVDDPRARHLRQPRRQPGETVAGRGERHDLQPQRRAGQRPAVDGEARRVGADLELLAHVGDDAVVRGRGRAEHGDVGRQRGEDVADPPVVGAEVVPPVRHAVRLVDDQQPDPLDEQRQHLLPELRVVEALGADEQEVDLVAPRAGRARGPSRRGSSS